ncbi:hypothetical protein B0H35_002281 [Clostridium acetobutylicum]|nr:hypothetical protein [Clostridium acetobutylicum]
MDIVESQNMSATITVSDNGKDVIVAYLNCSNLEPTAMIFNGNNSKCNEQATTYSSKCSKYRRRDTCTTIFKI